MRTFRIKRWLRDYIEEHSNEEIFFTACAIICLAFLIVAIIICIIKINQL